MSDKDPEEVARVRALLKHYDDGIITHHEFEMAITDPFKKTLFDLMRAGKDYGEARAGCFSSDVPTVTIDVQLELFANGFWMTPKVLGLPTFEEAWANKEAEGYQYGEDALEQVRFGWDIRSKYIEPNEVSIDWTAKAQMTLDLINSADSPEERLRIAEKCLKWAFDQRKK